MRSVYLFCPDRVGAGTYFQLVEGQYAMETVVPSDTLVIPKSRGVCTYVNVL